MVNKSQDEKNTQTFGLSQEYWDGLDEADKNLYRLVRPLRRASYSVQYSIKDIERTLNTMNSDAQLQGGQLELNPDFQRGHVWSEEKQIAFIEATLRGTAPNVIRFNCPKWTPLGSQGDTQNLNEHSIVCVDGLQRITAMRDFVAEKFKIFEKYTCSDLDDTSFSLKRMHFSWTLEMYEIASRKDLLQFYLDLNSGGVVHTQEELERVGNMLKEETNTEPKTTRTNPRPKKT